MSDDWQDKQLFGAHRGERLVSIRLLRQGGNNGCRL
jgi:hypothetical protein